MEARKISFQEAWDTTTIFFVDEELESEIDAEVESLLGVARDPRVSENASIDVSTVVEFLTHHENALEVILRDIEISDEKFMRIITLLRRMGRVPGGFEIHDSEWGMSRIKSKIANEREFANLIARVLVEGRSDQELARYIPRYYLDMLNYREIKGSSEAARRIRYKRSLIGTYGGRKGYKVENLIRKKLLSIQEMHGVLFEKGRSRMIETDIDFSVPSVNDPWIVIMSSFQETTSSGQSTKARDMFSAYERILRNNSRYGEFCAFVNFVDGGGWLARKRDFERLVENCHYFINLHFLDMLDSIVLKHIPDRYLQQE